jgi:Spy/CpxP family protein refolding chaperone
VNTWKVILATLVIFVAGLVTGAVVVWHSERLFSNPSQHQTTPPHPGPAVSTGGLRLDFLRRMQRDLNLSAAQNKEIDKLLKESQERSRIIMEPVAPQIREELARTREEFRKVLTPEQQARFEELLKHPPHRPDQQHRSGPPHDGAPDGRVQTNL